MVSNICNIKNKIYILVPGFLGNFEEGLMKKLYEYLCGQKQNVFTVDIYGYRNEEDILLPPLQNIISEIKNVYQQIRSEYFENEIVIVAHSQGCLTSLYAGVLCDANTSYIFLAPSLFFE